MKIHEVFQVQGSFVWEKSVQGDVLGSFFYGYMSCQILAGYLASKYGAKSVIGLAAFGGAILTLLSPLAANTSVYAFIAIRALLGFCQVNTFNYSKHNQTMNFRLQLSRRCMPCGLAGRPHLREVSLQVSVMLGHKLEMFL